MFVLPVQCWAERLKREEKENILQCNKSYLLSDQL